MGKNIKKILYIKAQGMGDIISSIPKLYELKEKGYETTLLWYDNKYFNILYDQKYLIDILYSNKLVKDIIFVPHKKIEILMFLIKKFKKFDIGFNPIRTIYSRLWGLILCKSYKYVFTSRNDIKKFRNIIEGEVGLKETYLNEYKKYLIFDNYKNQRGKYNISDRYITIFPSSYERSIDINEWIEVIKFINQRNIQVIILGGERDKWFIDDLEKITEQKLDIINLIGKTDFYDLCDILENSVCNILCNGGVMWLGNLMNDKNINIHTVSSFIQEPNVDSKNSFNIRLYEYKKCFPCEALGYRQVGIKGIPSCVFRGTKKEGECRNYIKSDNIINVIPNFIK